MNETIDARTLALRLISTQREAHLATIDGDRPRVRPMSVALVEGPTVYMGSFSHWGKVGEIRRNPHAELSFMDDDGRHLRLSGQARIREERELKEKVWEAYPLMKRYFTSPDDARYTLIEFRTERVRVKDGWELEYREVEPAALVQGS